MRSKKNKNHAWEQSPPIDFPLPENPSDYDGLFPQSFFNEYPSSSGDLSDDQQHKIEDPTNVIRNSQVDLSQNQSQSSFSIMSENSVFFFDPSENRIPIPIPPIQQPSQTYSLIPPQIFPPEQPPQTSPIMPPQILPPKPLEQPQGPPKKPKKVYRQYSRQIFAGQNSSEKNSAQRVQANILARIINETIEETISDEGVDCEIRDHNRILLKKKRLQKLTMLVGLVSEAPIEKQQKIYEFNRKIMYEALNDRALIKKMIIKSSKIQELDKKQQYMRQIKVYLHRLKSRLIATRTQSK